MKILRKNQLPIGKAAHKRRLGTRKTMMLARPKCETFPTVQQKTSNYVVAVTCQSDDPLGPYCIMLHFLLRKSK